MSKVDWMANIGSHNNPVSLLHEYAVGLIYDRIRYGLKSNKPVFLLTDSGISSNIIEGASQVRIPDEWTAIGGFYPDLALYNNDDTKPVRIVEVVITSPPASSKIETLEKRGVDVVVTRKLRDQYDLLILFGADRPFQPLDADNPKRRVLLKHMAEFEQAVRPHRQAVMPATASHKNGKIRRTRFVMMNDGSWGINIVAERSYQPVVGDHFRIDTNRGDVEDVILRKVVWRGRCKYPEYPNCDTILATISKSE